MKKLESLSVVVPLYKSSEYVEEFYRRITVVADRVAQNTSIIFVDDGCPDGSARAAKRACKDDSRVTVLKLSRNFGQHKALMAGLSVTESDWVYSCDADLEEPPELLEKFVRELQSSPVDLLAGVQSNRRGSGVGKWMGFLFYKVFNRLSNVSVPENLTAVFLMSARFRKALLPFRESHLYLAGVVELVGLSRRTIPIDKRFHGDTSYSFKQRFVLAVNAVTSFSAAPLMGLLYLGGVMTIFSLLAFIVLAVVWSSSSEEVGWLLLMGAISFFGSLIVFSIGLVGVYVAKIFEEVKRRPGWIIEYAWKGGGACRD